MHHSNSVYKFRIWHVFGKVLFMRSPYNNVLHYDKRTNIFRNALLKPHNNNNIVLFLVLEILCPPPVVPLNGLLIEDSAPGRHVVGSVVQFSCGEKHQLIGKPSMVCTENGTWSHTTPYCEHIKRIIYSHFQLVVI